MPRRHVMKCATGIALSCPDLFCKAQGVMPPRLQALQKTLSLEVFQGPSLVHHRYETTTLTRIRSWRAQWLPDCQPAPRVRHASTVTPATVVNAAKVVPSQVRGVYEALEVLQKDAGVYTSLSQLQLALRGLESENPVTRIAGKAQISTQKGWISLTSH